MSEYYGSFDVEMDDLLTPEESDQPQLVNNQKQNNLDLIEVTNEEFTKEFGLDLDLDSLFTPMVEETPTPGPSQSKEFLQISPDDVRKMIENEQNNNTLRKTLYDCGKFERFLAQKNEKRPIAQIESDVLDEYLANFILSVKKADGEDYEPTSIRNMVSSIDRKLKRQKYPHRIIGNQSNIFQLSRDALQAKQKSLKRLGKGNKPQKSSPITDEEINILYEKDILGRKNSKSLLNTVWLNNCIHFGLRGTKENYNLRWGDITLKRSSDGLEYLELMERQTKTRTGANVTDVREITPKIFATPTDPDRCPVETYKLYMAKRPQDYCECNHHFYISPRTSSQGNSDNWFMKSVVGEKKIGAFLKTMAVDGGLDANKRLTNHSTRKHLVQKLRDAGVAPTDIMQISGHKNIQSVMNYSAMSEQKHKECSTILSSRSKPTSTVTCLGDNESSITSVTEANDQIISVVQQDTHLKKSVSEPSNIPSVENMYLNLPHPVSRQPASRVDNPQLYNQETLKMNTMLSSVFSGMLEDDDVTSSANELFEAIGPFLEQVDDNMTEVDIKEICDRLYHLVAKDLPVDSEKNGPHKILDAPVHLGSLIDNIDTSQQAASSIWINKKANNLQVNAKQLAKAEAMIQKKQKKQADKDSTTVKKPNGVMDGPSASQQLNRKDMKLEASGTNRSYDIRIDDFDIAFGDKVLITGASIHLSAGRRYGLCGRNGLGKTTLLKMVSSGSLKIPSHIRILHVEQEVIGDETVSLDSVLECDFERNALLTREKEITLRLNASPNNKGDNTLSSELSEIYHKLESIEADKAPARAAVILAGLGFTTAMQRAHTKSLSGGWRMRLALARALFSKPDLLLLDEPTNMLDMKAIIWLENYLQTWATTIFVVSHDRSFLNSICTDIVHLSNKTLETYKGNYDQFDKTKEERIKNQRKEYEAQKQYRDHIQVFIDRFRYNANRASQVQSKLKLLEKLPVLIPPPKDTDVTMKFPECDKLAGNILQLDEVQFYYNKGSVIFDDVNCNATMSSRICIVGENGAGKTTLLKILLGEHSPTKGVRHAHRSLRIGYFSQHHVDQLEMDLSSVELLAQRFPGRTVEQYRGALGQYGVSGELGTRPVSSLSGGQKSRVAFAVMSMSNPNFFILDEPTNHLDMETIEALGEALNKFEGGVILVSHDERLIKVVCKELWVVKDKKVLSLEGGFDEYKKFIEDELAAQGC